MTEYEPVDEAEDAGETEGPEVEGHVLDVQSLDPRRVLPASACISINSIADER